MNIKKKNVQKKQLKHVQQITKSLQVYHILRIFLSFYLFFPRVLRAGAVRQASDSAQMKPLQSGRVKDGLEPSQFSLYRGS